MVLFPQNGDRIVTIDYMTSPPSVYKFVERETFTEIGIVSIVRRLKLRSLR